MTWDHVQIPSSFCFSFIKVKWLENPEWQCVGSCRDRGLSEWEKHALYLGTMGMGQVKGWVTYFVRVTFIINEISNHELLFPVSGGSGGGVQQLQLAEGRSQREWLEFFHVNLKKWVSQGNECIEVVLHIGWEGVIAGEWKGDVEKRASVENIVSFLELLMKLNWLSDKERPPLLFQVWNITKHLGPCFLSLHTST